MPEEEEVMSHEELTDVEPHELPEEMREDAEETQPVEEEPVEEQQMEEEPEVEETEVEDDVVTDSQGRPLTQAELDEKIQRRLRRYDRKKEKEWEKKLREQFGTSNLDEAAQFYQAGRAVSERAGAPPTTIMERLRGKYTQAQQQPQPQGGERTMQNTQPMNPGGSDPTLEEIRELKEMLEEEREQKARQQQQKQARQEFGDLFEDYKMDIEDYAEDYGLPLQDAAAAVLRPHLKDHYQKRERKKRKVQRRKKVESTEEAPESQEEDPAAILTPREKEVARKMGMTQKRYYERAKTKGRFDGSG